MRLHPARSSRASNPSRAAALLAAIEPCEPRRLLASVSGLVFGDANKNGTRDAGESGVANVTVYADRNYNGQLDAGDLKTVTSADGRYAIDGIPADGKSLAIRLLGVATSAITAPAGGAHSAKFASDYAAGNRNFAVATAAPTVTSVSGLLFDDANGNGKRDAGEPAIYGGEAGSYRIYADLNHNAAYDNGEPLSNDVVAPDKTYTIANLPVGLTVDLRFYYGSWADAGMYQTTPAGFGTPLTVTTTAAPITNADFGFKRAGTLSVDLRFDVNRDGTAQSGEPLFNGQGRAWIDLDKDGTRDAGEPLVPHRQLGESFPNDVNTYEIGVPFGTYAIAFSRTPGVGAVAESSVITTSSSADPYKTVLVPIAPPKSPAISGVAFYDTDRDGTRDAGEDADTAATIYADYNNNGTHDVGEDSTTIDPYLRGDASYFLPVLADREFVLRNSARPSLAYTVKLSGTQTIVRDFAIQPAAPTATVTGTVYADTDKDGIRDAGEVGLGNYVVYGDLNYNGVKDANEPTATTNASGFYSLAVPTGPNSVAIRLRDVYPSYVTAPAGGVHSAKFTTAYVAANRNFGVAVTAPTLYGFAYHDVDRNGVRRSDEPALDAVLYLDANNNGKLDAGERSTTPGANGRFEFANVPVGVPVTVRAFMTDENVPALIFVNADSAYFPGITLTPQSGPYQYVGDFVGTDLAGTIAANVFRDLDGDGARDAFDRDVAVADVWLDLNKNGAHDAAEPSLPEHFTGNGDPIGQRALSISARPGTYTVAVRYAGDADLKADATRVVTVTEAGGAIAGFAQASTQSVVRGLAFDDVNGNGARDAGEPGVSLAGVFADYDNDGFLDAGEPEAPTEADGSYALEVDNGRTFTLRASANYHDADAVGVSKYAVRFDTTGTRTGLNFALPTAGAVVNGTVFADLDGDGVRDAGEPGRRGVGVYADLNGDGAWTQGEPRDTPDAAGAYTLAGLPANNGPIAIRLDGVFGAVSTPTGGSHTVKFATPAVANGRDFGTAGNAVANVRGSVFYDLDGNGGRGQGEGSLSGATVFADYDNDGVRDANEPGAVTTAGGGFEFGTKAGAYVLRIASVGGRVQTSPVGATLARYDTADEFSLFGRLLGGTAV